MKDKIIHEVQSILRSQLSPQELLKAVQAQSPMHFGGTDKMDPNITGLSPEGLIVDPRLIRINHDNEPIFEVDQIFFTIPGLKEKKLKFSFSKGLNSSLFRITGRGPALTLQYSQVYDKILDQQKDIFTIIGASFDLQNVRIERI